MPNKGVLSLYNISYLESDFNLIIRKISNNLKCEASIELYNSISSKFSSFKDNDLKMIFSDMKKRSEKNKEKPFYMFRKFIEYLTPIDYNQSNLQLFNQINTNSINYQENIYGLPIPTKLLLLIKF